MYSDSLKFEITTTQTTVKVEARSKFPQSAHNKALALQEKGIISIEEQGTHASFSVTMYTFADPQPAV